ncbi:MAG TPA: DNA repair protein RecN [Blastocatellia bacterium]|nr:DNA repair protein RecN [Blastocatellia bacterium]
MLSLLNIQNVALIEDLQIEFDRGLNLLTGETGSGKSIIVDALGVLIGGRFASDMLKSGESRASIEGLFSLHPVPELETLLEGAGIEIDRDQIIVRRELAAGGRNKIFVNNQLATQSVLRDLRPFLVDIHGQGEQQTLLNPDTHLDLLDDYAGLESLRTEVADRYRRWASLKTELEGQQRDEAEKLQLIDILQFQIEELERAELAIGEDERLEEERRRLNNTEKLSALCAEGFAATYEDNDSGIARIGQAQRRVEELAEYDSSFRNYLEALESARALLEDLAFSLRNFAERLEFSPARLAEIENRLAELSRLKRKYGGSIETALEHLAKSQDRLAQLERSDEREKELRRQVEEAAAAYLETARRLRRERSRAIKKFQTGVERSLAEVAMENARLEVRMTAAWEDGQAGGSIDSPQSAPGELFTGRGIDRVEFYFSANVGEPVRPLARVASGGEASRLMLVLKTMANAARFPRSIVFDEIDSGIGGRVSEAVGLKLKKLSETNQVLCVTHQPQIARFADCHLLLRKEVVAGRTVVRAEKLDRRARVEEIARMLTGADITETARRHAREMLKTV